MQFQFRTIIAAISLSIGLIIVTPASALTYTAIDLGTLGGRVGYATGINNTGQVVGYSYTTDSVHAFITGANGVGMTDLGTLGGSASFANSINNAGQVAGVIPMAGGTQHAFITGANGVGMTDLSTLGGSSSRANGINNAGQVVGFSSLPTDRLNHAFITGAGAMSDLGTLDGHDYGNIGSNAFGINDSGQVVGFTLLGGDNDHAFITGPNGVGMTDLGTLGGPQSFANGINKAGQVVGSSSTVTSSSHAFITGANGVGMTDLGTLGGWGTSFAYSINNAGQVVGSSDRCPCVLGSLLSPHAFVTGANGTEMTDLNSLVTLDSGIDLTDATGINDMGQIIANGSNAHAYLLTAAPAAVPVPAAAWLFSSGLIGLVGFSRKRKEP